MRLWRRQILHITKSVGVFIVIVMTVVGLRTAPASADHFTAIRMEDSFMNFGSDEDNDDHFLFWNHFVHHQIFDQYHARTDLIANELCRKCYDTSTDIVWFAYPLGTNPDGSIIAGDESCRKSFPPPNQACDRARVRFNESLTRTISGGVGFALACHEVGHAVGFDHHGGSCMVSPMVMSAPPSNVLTDHMITHINDYY